MNLAATLKRTGSSRRPDAATSFTTRAAITLIAYEVGYYPGLILNWMFLTEARKIRNQTGEWPDGTRLLRSLEFIFFWCPLLSLVGLILLILLDSSMASQIWNALRGK